jgi:hypothetical protein
VRPDSVCASRVGYPPVISRRRFGALEFVHHIAIAECLPKIIACTQQDVGAWIVAGYPLSKGIAEAEARR